MKNETLGKLFLHELEMEAPATRACIMAVPADMYEYKPHETSMKMKSLVSVCAEIPSWIVFIVDDSEINFATYKNFSADIPEAWATRFDDNMAAAKKVLEKISDKEMEEIFTLKHGDQVLSSDTKKDSIMSSINHLAHHRGQLTVYMRMNGIKVPRIYGPSGDDRSWK